MIKNVPKSIFCVGALEPVLALLDDTFMTPGELAKHWRYDGPGSLANLRRAGKPPKFVKLPGGAVRYRVSDILRCELEATQGPLDLDGILLAISACVAISLDDRKAVIEHVKGALSRA